MKHRERFTYRFVVPPSVCPDASTFLSRETGLSKARVKDAMNKGAVWLRRVGRGRLRVRRAAAGLRPGDVIEFFHDAELLSREPSSASCVMDRELYCIWHKPAGLHQIRRHLAALGHPVMGDPRYGAGNRDGKPMRLVAWGLGFDCPFSGERIEASLSP